MGDFRVGYLLPTPPRLQYAAQLIGTLAATFVAPAVFILFTTAYPCVLVSPNGGNSTNTGSERCEFSGPSIAAWRAVAVAATESQSPIPESSQGFSILIAIAGSVSVLIKHYLWTEKWQFIRAYHPNMIILALAFTLPSPPYGIAFTAGALLAKTWRIRYPIQFDLYAFAIAAGLVAGEGIGGTVNGGLAILGVGEGNGEHKSDVQPADARWAYHCRTWKYSAQLSSYLMFLVYYD